MSDYKKLNETLSPIGLPNVATKFVTATPETPLPDAFIVYQLIFSDDNEHYDGKAYAGRNRYSVTLYIRNQSILETTFNLIHERMLAAGYLAVPGGRDGSYPETGHYSRQRDYNFYEEVKFNA